MFSPQNLARTGLSKKVSIYSWQQATIGLHVASSPNELSRFSIFIVLFVWNQVMQSHYFFANINYIAGHHQYEHAIYVSLYIEQKPFVLDMKICQHFSVSPEWNGGHRNVLSILT